MNQPVNQWDDARLDAALAALGVALDTPNDLDQVHDRVFSLARSTDSPVARSLAGRRRLRRIVASSAGVVILTTGGVAAAASGVLDLQATQAFTSTTPFEVSSGDPVKRASIATPDGGLAQLWTRDGTDSCQTILFTDPGVREPDKPYMPSSGCHTGTSLVAWEIGTAWTGQDGRHFTARAGHVDTDAVEVRFLTMDGQHVEADVVDGYYIAFTPVTRGEDPYNGLDWTDARGHTTHERTPQPVSTVG